VVAVIVRRDQMIDLTEASILDGPHDAIAVAHSYGPAVTGVDQD